MSGLTFEALLGLQPVSSLQSLGDISPNVGRTGEPPERGRIENRKKIEKKTSRIPLNSPKFSQSALKTRNTYGPQTVGGDGLHAAFLGEGESGVLGGGNVDGLGECFGGSGNCLRRSELKEIEDLIGPDLETTIDSTNYTKHYSLKPTSHHSKHKSRHTSRRRATKTSDVQGQGGYSGEENTHKQNNTNQKHRHHNTARARNPDRNREENPDKRNREKTPDETNRENSKKSRDKSREKSKDEKNRDKILEKSKDEKNRDKILEKSKDEKKRDKILEKSKDEKNRDKILEKSKVEKNRDKILEKSKDEKNRDNIREKSKDEKNTDKSHEKHRGEKNRDKNREKSKDKKNRDKSHEKNRGEKNQGENRSRSQDKHGGRKAEHGGRYNRSEDKIDTHREKENGHKVSLERKCDKDGEKHRKHHRRHHRSGEKARYTKHDRSHGDKYDKNGEMYDGEKYDKYGNKFDKNGHKYDKQNYKYDKYGNKYDKNADQYDKYGNKYDRKDFKYDKYGNKYDRKNYKNHTSSEKYNETAQKREERHHRHKQNTRHQGHAIQDHANRMAPIIPSISETYNSLATGDERRKRKRRTGVLTEDGEESPKNDLKNSEKDGDKLAQKSQKNAAKSIGRTRNSRKEDSKNEKTDRKLDSRRNREKHQSKLPSKKRKRNPGIPAEGRASVESIIFGNFTVGKERFSDGYFTGGEKKEENSQKIVQKIEKNPPNRRKSLDFFERPKLPPPPLSQILKYRIYKFNKGKISDSAETDKIIENNKSKIMLKNLFRNSHRNASKYKPRYTVSEKWDECETSTKYAKVFGKKNFKLKFKRMFSLFNKFSHLIQNRGIFSEANQIFGPGTHEGKILKNVENMNEKIAENSSKIQENNTSIMADNTTVQEEIDAADILRSYLNTDNNIRGIFRNINETNDAKLTPQINRDKIIEQPPASPINDEKFAAAADLPRQLEYLYCNYSPAILEECERFVENGKEMIENSETIAENAEKTTENAEKIADAKMLQNARLKIMRKEVSNTGIFEGTQNIATNVHHYTKDMQIYKTNLSYTKEIGETRFTSGASENPPFRGEKWADQMNYFSSFSISWNLVGENGEENNEKIVKKGDKKIRVNDPQCAWTLGIPFPPHVRRPHDSFEEPEPLKRQEIDKTKVEIEENMAGIEENMAGIEKNMAGIEENRAAIEDNTAAIEDNTAAIEENIAQIEANVEENAEIRPKIDENITFTVQNTPANKHNQNTQHSDTQFTHPEINPQKIHQNYDQIHQNSPNNNSQNIFPPLCVRQVDCSIDCAVGIWPLPSEHGKTTTKLAENGKNFTENGEELTENGDKLTENGDKLTENGEKLTENSEKLIGHRVNGDEISEAERKKEDEEEFQEDIENRANVGNRLWKGRNEQNNGKKKTSKKEEKQDMLQKLDATQNLPPPQPKPMQECILDFLNENKKPVHYGIFVLEENSPLKNRASQSSPNSALVAGTIATRGGEEVCGGHDGKKDEKYVGGEIMAHEGKCVENDGKNVENDGTNVENGRKNDGKNVENDGKNEGNHRKHGENDAKNEENDGKIFKTDENIIENDEKDQTNHALNPHISNANNIPWLINQHMLEEDASFAEEVPFEGQKEENLGQKDEKLGQTDEKMGQKETKMYKGQPPRRHQPKRAKNRGSDVIHELRVDFEADQSCEKPTENDKTNQTNHEKSSENHEKTSENHEKSSENHEKSSENRKPNPESYEQTASDFCARTNQEEDHQFELREEADENEEEIGEMDDKSGENEKISFSDEVELVAEDWKAQSTAATRDASGGGEDSKIIENSSENEDKLKKNEKKSKNKMGKSIKSLQTAERSASQSASAENSDLQKNCEEKEGSKNVEKNVEGMNEKNALILDQLKRSINNNLDKMMAKGLIRDDDSIESLEDFAMLSDQDLEMPIPYEGDVPSEAPVVEPFCGTLRKSVILKKKENAKISKKSKKNIKQNAKNPAYWLKNKFVKKELNQVKTELHSPLRIRSPLKNPNYLNPSNPTRDAPLLSPLRNPLYSPIRTSAYSPLKNTTNYCVQRLALEPTVGAKNRKKSKQKSGTKSQQISQKISQKIPEIFPPAKNGSFFDSHAKDSQNTLQNHNNRGKNNSRKNTLYSSTEENNTSLLLSVKSEPSEQISNANLPSKGTNNEKYILKNSPKSQTNHKTIPRNNPKNLPKIAQKQATPTNEIQNNPPKNTHKNSETKKKSTPNNKITQKNQNYQTNNNDKKKKKNKPSLWQTEERRSCRITSHKIQMAQKMLVKKEPIQAPKDLDQNETDELTFFRKQYYDEDRTSHVLDKCPLLKAEIHFFLNRSKPPNFHCALRAFRNLEDWLVRPNNRTQPLCMGFALGANREEKAKISDDEEILGELLSVASQESIFPSDLDSD